MAGGQYSQGVTAVPYQSLESLAHGIRICYD